MLDTSTMTREQLEAKIAELSAAKAVGGLKIGAKGGLSVYGIQKFPITLYAEGWQRLLARGPEILAFIEANQAQLKWKATAAEVAEVASLEDLATAE